MIRDQQMICDGCEKVITRISTVPEGEWGKMHNLCSECFRALWKQSIPPA
jgi:hypothetical protein